MIELLLVLALLVILATTAYPAFVGPMENQKLRRSADRIRAAWGQAQVQAMKTGRMHMFRFQKNTNIFEIRPFENMDASVESSDTQNQFDMARPDAFVTADTIPDEMRFAQVTTVADIRSAFAQQQMQQSMTQTAEDLNEAWSQPILFYPDGSTSNARLLIANDRYYVMLQLRGLTGVAQVSDLLSPDQLPDGTTP